MGDKKIKFMDLHAQYLSIKTEVDAAIEEVIANTAFIGGEQLRRFEKDFANFNKARYCVGVGNCTDALEIALESLDLPENSEVIVPANSFIATSEAVTRSGHRVVFCDCGEDNSNLDVENAARLITPQTAVIIAVHLYGRPCDMDEVMELASAHGLKVIEDCAQAHGAEYKGKKVGTFGELGVFSFYPGKNLGAYGDGGAIISNDEILSKKCRMIANHGRLTKFEHEFEGRNSRLDNLQAAILSVKLKYLESWTEKRRYLASRYREKLNDVSGLKLAKIDPNVLEAYHLFVVETRKRDELRDYLTEQGVATGLHYPITLPALKAYEHLGHVTQDFPNASIKAIQSLSLPLYPELDEVQQDYVIERILEFFRRLPDTSL